MNLDSNGKLWDEITRKDDEAERVAKFVFTKDNAVAESVLYRYPDYATRTVICCSTQSGCPFGCRFCGAGDFFVRSLTTEEIISQPVHLLDNIVYEDYGVTPADMGRLQIMFMSMGEPLLNMKNLEPALDVLYAKYPEAALLISTSAPVVDYGRVRTVSERIPTIGLQFSIHESTDAARDALIPFKKKLNLIQIAEEGRKWYETTGRMPYFNYCAHDDNSSEEDADRLRALFDPAIFCATVSVICERNEGLPATNAHQRSLATSFGDRLLERGYDVRVFDPAGQDTIGGGCGQLWFVQKWAEEHEGHLKTTAGTGLPSVHVPSERISETHVPQEAHTPQEIGRADENAEEIKVPNTDWIERHWMGRGKPVPASEIDRVEVDSLGIKRAA